jgi:hypothetical protein
MSYFDDASLAFLPKGAPGKDGKAYSIKPDNGDGDFTFSRGSNLAATRVGPTGLIEKGRENLLTYSNDFSQWTKLNTTPTSGQSGYDGTNDATEISFTAGSSRAIGKGGLTTSIVNFSIYVKAGTHDFIQFTPSNSATTFANFEISTSNPATGNTGGLVVDSSIEDVGNGWYRCSAVINNSGSGTMWVWIVDSLTSGRAAAVSADGTFFVQDAQLELGLAATDYIESGATTGKAGLLEDEPRFDYSGGATCPSLLLEPSRSQLIPYTEYFEGTGWGEVGSFTLTTKTDEVTSPEGLNNATLLTSANATSEQYLTIGSLSTTSGQDYTLSIIAKKKDFDFIMLKFQGSGGAFSAGSVWFNLSTGVVATEDSGKTGHIQEIGNGWYKCSAVATATATGSSGVGRVQLASADSTDAVAGDGSKGTYIYGAGLELGSYPTSYIPNHSGGIVTRGVDDAYATGLSSSIGQTEGAIYTEFKLNTTSLLTTGVDRVAINDGSTNNWIFLGVEDGNEIRAYLRFSNSVIFSLETTNAPIQPDTTYKLCLKYSSGDSKVFLNGTQILASTATYGSPSAPIDDFIITGSNFIIGNSSQVIARDSKQILLFDTALSDADCITLTT